MEVERSCRGRVSIYHRKWSRDMTQHFLSEGSGDMLTLHNMQLPVFIAPSLAYIASPPPPPRLNS